LLIFVTYYLVLQNRIYIFTFIQVGIESNDCSTNLRVLAVVRLAKSLWLVAAKFYHKL